MSAPMDILFHTAVKRVFSSWTGLQLAVQQGFGGPESAAKAEWMVDVVYQWFQENEDIEPDELDDFLCEILNTEFDMTMEDGSVRQVSTDICRFYRLCAAGKDKEVQSRIEQLPQPNIASSIAQEEEEDEDEDEDMDTSHTDDPNLMAGQLGHLSLHQSEQSTTESGASASQSESAVSAQVPPTAEDMEEKSKSDEDDDDGWTVVKKGKRR